MTTLRLLKFDAQEYAIQTKSRTAETERAYIDGYPEQLWIYRLAASRYWWIRYYWNGKVCRKSTKQTGKREAVSFAKSYYDNIITQGTVLDPQSSVTNFGVLGEAAAVTERAKLQRGELTKMTYDNFVYRYQKSVLPYFGDLDVKNINYQALENYVTELSATGISGTTIRSYLQIVRRVLMLACRRGLLPAVPEFPSVKIKLKARGWFSPVEYLTLYRTARRLAGVTMEIRKYQDSLGNQQTRYVRRDDRENKLGTRMCYVKMTQDLRWLIVFMVNGYIRPTDIRHMQHMHVDVVRGDYTYLRLRLPESKGHTNPITTMPRAVTAYLALRRQHEGDSTAGEVSGDDYVFVPKYPDSRDHALNLLQRQFEVLIGVSGLPREVQGETRSLYSLRHSSIMYRLLYGDGINTLVLARNARTSVEMIDRFYARPLSGEMNIDMLQSKRRRRRRVE
jgi:hypothetical protein